MRISRTLQGVAPAGSPGSPDHPFGPAYTGFRGNPYCPEGEGQVPPAGWGLARCFHYWGEYTDSRPSPKLTVHVSSRSGDDNHLHLAQAEYGGSVEAVENPTEHWPGMSTWTLRSREGLGRLAADLLEVPFPRNSRDIETLNLMLDFAGEWGWDPRETTAPAGGYGKPRS